MTAEQIAELRRLDADAKQPPWVDEGGYVFPGDPDEVERESIWIFGTQDCGHPPTAEFIVAMRNAFRALLDEREALLTAAGMVARSEHLPGCKMVGYDDCTCHSDILDNAIAKASE